MKSLMLFLFRRNTVLVVSVYALLIRLMLIPDAPAPTLIGLFLALVSQLGHRALDYYGSVKDAVRGVVGAHADRLADADRSLAEHAKRLTVAEQNVARVAQTVEKRGAF